jgi:hypothetical protein
MGWRKRKNVGDGRKRREKESTFVLEINGGLLGRLGTHYRMIFIRVNKGH